MRFDACRERAMSPRRYRNFFVNISRLDASGVAHVSVSGLTPGPRVTDVVPIQYRSDYFFIDDNGRQVDLLDKIKRRPVKSEYLYRLGILLSDLVLPGKIREGFLQSYATVRNNGNRLRLRIILDEPQLTTLPWEYLYLESEPGARNVNDFLVLQPNLSFARLAVGNTSEQSLPAGGKYRLTAALASPREEDPLNLEADRDAIQAAINNARSVGEIVPQWAFPATANLLREKLRDGCDIFHFSGHGLYTDPDGQILLQKEDGTGDPLSATILSQLLVASMAKVAVLSACDTGKFSAANPFGGVATSLAGSGIPAVIASQFRLLDKNALPLVREIYLSLIGGNEIDDGVYLARQAILLNSGFENRDWGALVLYLRGEDGAVFRREEAAPSRRLVPRILPTPLQSPLLGRSETVTEMGRQIATGRNFYLHGGVGIGKTSLATAIFSTVANEQRFPDGYLWASAQGLNAERLLEYLGSNFPDQTVSKVASKADKINELRRVLAGYPKLLIGLDNVTMVDAARSVLDAAGKCSVVLNGETAFDLGGRAQAIEVQPLDSVFAQELFLAEAKLKPESLAPGDLDLIAKICDRLRGLPLGIKIAAGKCAEGESLQMVWDRIDAAPGALATDAIETLVDAIFEELRDAPEAGRLLIRLASFPALEASIRALQGEPDDNEDLTTFFQAKDKLLALHVVERAGADRLALHPLLGPLIVQKADRTMVAAEREQMLHWLAEHARQHRGDFTALALEHRNFIAFLDFLKRRKRWKAIAALMQDLFDYLRIRGLWSEALSRLDLCLAHEADLSDTERALSLLQRGFIRTLLSRYDGAASDLDRAQKISEVNGDQIGVGRAQYRRAALKIWKGDLEGAARELRDAIRNMGEDAPHNDRAGAHSRLGGVLSLIASPTEAIGEFRQALSIAEQSGDTEQQARAHRAIGRMHERTGDVNSAKEDYDRALDLAETLGDGLQRANIQQSIGQMQYHSSRFDEARSSFETALRQFREMGYQPGIASSLHALANVCLAKRAYPEAERQYRDSLKINEALGHVQQAAYNRYQLGILLQRRGDNAAAEEQYKDALSGARQRKDQTLEGGALVQLAKLAQVQGDLLAATNLAKQALAVGNRTDDRLTEGFANVILGNLDDAYKALAPFDSQEAKAILEQLASSARSGDSSTGIESAFDRNLFGVGSGGGGGVESGGDGGVESGDFDRVLDIDSPSGGVGSGGGGFGPGSE
jgi:tetratricopeptide (TPR) repeat protein